MTFYIIDIYDKYEQIIYEQMKASIIIIMHKIYIHVVHLYLVKLYLCSVNLYFFFSHMTKTSIMWRIMNGPLSVFTLTSKKAEPNVGHL